MNPNQEITRQEYFIFKKNYNTNFHEFQQYKENNAKVEDKGPLIQDAVKNVGQMFRRKTVAVRVSWDFLIKKYKQNQHKKT